MTHPVYVSNQKSEDFIDLLFVTDGTNSHFVYIKDFNRFMRNKTKNNNKGYFCRYCLQCFTSETVLIDHKIVCLTINDKQSVTLRSGSIKFKKSFQTNSCTI